MKDDAVKVDSVLQTKATASLAKEVEDELERPDPSPETARAALRPKDPDKNEQEG